MRDKQHFTDKKEEKLSEQKSEGSFLLCIWIISPYLKMEIITGLFSFITIYKKKITYTKKSVETILTQELIINFTINYNEMARNIE